MYRFITLDQEYNIELISFSFLVFVSFKTTIFKTASEKEIKSGF